ncbi:hypothetical protein GSF22_18395, partial [Micromonospora echinofusca]|nr:hypothetical protein [Micromonospora echinofusca]
PQAPPAVPSPADGTGPPRPPAGTGPLPTPAGTSAAAVAPSGPTGPAGPVTPPGGPVPVDVAAPTADAGPPTGTWVGVLLLAGLAAGGALVARRRRHADPDG